jgi:hypothetical protein
MGRTWVGWDRYATDDELWAMNRRLWSLAEGAAEERFATLSYDGVIVVVAEITGRTRYPMDDGWKWTLDDRRAFSCAGRPSRLLRLLRSGTAPPPQAAAPALVLERRQVAVLPPIDQGRLGELARRV